MNQRKLNDLYDYGLKIYQIDMCFKFSIDSILLAEAAKVKSQDVLLDFCTGNGCVPLILSTKCNNKIFGIEIQSEIYDLALESVKINNLESQISIINDNILNASNYFPGNSFDIITCNPPYFKYNDSSLIATDAKKSMARHEISITLKDLIEKANFLLKEKGTFYITYRVNRFQELINEITKNRFSIKQIYAIKTGINANIELIIVEAIKYGKTEQKLKIIETDRKKSYKGLFDR